MNRVSILFFVLALLVPSLAEAQSTTACTMQYAPVCGTQNGVYATFSNGCVLGVEGAVYQHEGECTETELSGLAGAETYTPPAHCTAWFDGCNRCGRGEGGEAFCTLMACTGEPRAGYCTAYGDSVTEPAPLAPVASSAPLAEATQALETALGEVDATGFFDRVWAAVTAWVQGLVLETLGF